VSAPKIHAYQIWYDERSRAALDPAFEPLQNTNERVDWYEYWPIRSFLASRSLDEDAHYGFFSPLFSDKTGLRGQQVLDFASRHPEADVITFSPFPCHGAVFYNVFEQGESCFPGFGHIALRFLQEFDPNLQFDAICNDSRDTVYCNFFLAKPRFWQAWNRIFSRCFELAEDASSPLGRELARAVSYVKVSGETKPSDLKIMLMERIPSFMLARERFRVVNYPPFALPLSYTFRDKLTEVMQLDAWKAAYRDRGDEAAIRQFVVLRNQVLRESLGQQPPA
jgi:hypothetical protein